MYFSHLQLIVEVLEKVRNFLARNCYVEKLNSKIFRIRFHRFYNKHKRNRHINVFEVIEKYVLLPYVQYLSEKLNEILYPSNINVAHRTVNNFQHLFTKLKHVVSKDKQAHIRNRAYIVTASIWVKQNNI